MALLKYKEKRNFTNTPEPSSSKTEEKGALRFVVQRHDASHLHYDFRLEMEGVLKSWAVPKGPSLNPKDKRLAMMVEDHPFAYRTFEGVIPKGNYGAGIVEIWDEGTYHALDTTDRKESEAELLNQLEAGSLKFVLHGKKLNGEFALVQMHGKTENAWLLIKHKDEYALEEAYNSEDHVLPLSKIKKKEHPDIEEAPPKQETVKAENVPESTKGKDPMFHNVKPMLAKIKEKPFDDEGWIFEIKWDGYRAIAEIENGKVNLYSRNLLPFNSKYPTLVKELEGFKYNVILDGEIVVLDKNGVSDFQALQYFGERPVSNLFYYVFDILYLNGFDLRTLPQITRKEYLKQVLPSLDHIKFSDHVEAKGVDFFKLAKEQHLEGVMAKKADAAYKTGLRSENWLKIKISKRQEAVIGGYTAGRGSRTGFGALVLGVYEKGKLVYIGHTGGGFDEKGLKEVKGQLEELAQPNSPFEEKVKTNEKVTWVQPKLVCEVLFAGWTAEMHMRQPIFHGMRMDKNPEEVVREVENLSGVKEEEEVKEEGNTSLETTSQHHEVKTTNLTKIFWPSEGYTKGDVIEYYQQIAPYILPYLKDRPQSLNRHPNGIDKPGFFHKDMGDDLPPWITTVKVFSESNAKDIHYLVCQDIDTLRYISNLGCIEINTWHSRIQSLEKPDYCLIDLDPGENTFDEVIETALVTKSILNMAGAEAFCKTSGATGIHILIPLGAKYDFDQSKDFAHLIVQMVHAQLPQLTSLERNPKTRQKLIYLDYLQNRTGQTMAAPYCIRPKPGATASTPLEWQEVKKGLLPSQFTIKTIHERLKMKGDLLEGLLGKGIDMGNCLEKLS